MPATFGDCDSETLALAKEMLELHHRDLHEAGVDIYYRFKFGAPKAKGPTLTLHGRACAAIVQIHSADERSRGSKDVTITIDGDTWKDRPVAEKKAILDHEQSHPLLVRDKKTGQLMLADDQRPKLKMRQHDVEVGGFEEVMKRHKLNALESQSLAEIFSRDTVQGVLNFG